MTHRPRILRAPYHACSLAVILVAGAQLADAGLDTRAMLLLGASAVLVYGGLCLRVHDVSRSAGGASQSMHAAVATLLGFLVGPWVAGLAAVVASIAYDVRRRRSFGRLVGNLPTRVVPIALAGVTWQALGGHPGSMSLPGDYLGLVAGALVFAIANEACFIWDSMSAADLSQARWRDELERMPANLRSTTLECLVAAAVAVICLHDPWASPVVLPLAASLYVALDRGNRIQQVTDRALDTFATIVDERDRYTFEHSDRVCEYAMRIGRRMGLTERQLEGLYWTSRLHDLGKVAVDNSILNKPGRLDAEEFAVMQVHPEVSARILASFSFDQYDADVVRCHHERYDGRGYLSRSREDVPLEAFIIAVADAWDAMTSDRPYREALPEQVALEEIALGLGTQFHPEVGRAFLAEMGFDLEAAIERLQVGADPGDPAAGSVRSRRPRPDLGDDIRDVA
jgi:HD-GYP domain-containing protein (c-di-GMP phosphodiesterase class II)